MAWFWPSSNPRVPWYAAGLAFECTGCGRCCAGPNEGYVWVTDEEIAAIAGFLAVSIEEVRRQFSRRVDGRFSLIERPENHDCVFLAPATAEGASRGCRIYSVRPFQCRNWPFWPRNLGSPDDWSRAAARCPGVNRGAKFSPEQIDERLRPPKAGP
jgi:hypothetical protein